MAASTLKRVSCSFRDPSGRLVQSDGRILRLLSAESWAELEPALQSSAIRAAVRNGEWIESRLLDDAEAGALMMDSDLGAAAEGIQAPVILEHERIAFQTFPYEWTPSMLAEAASLTIRLSLALLEEGFQLKDATPFNILFRGSQPVWIDASSIERRDPLNPVWLACGQFHRTFLLPLLTCRQARVGTDQILLTRREGLDPEAVYEAASWGQRLSGRMLGPVTVPTLLGKLGKAGSPGMYAPRRCASAAEAKFVLKSLYRGLEKQIRTACPPPKDDSHWARYTATTHSDEYYALRSGLLQEILDELKPRSVLDIGCNTGLYSCLAARSGAAVVGVDIDEGALDAMRIAARRENLDVSACRANLCCPTPATGWLNSECSSLVDRLQGRFDGVLMFAVLHHFLVTERVPMPEVARFAASLTRDWLLVEFVSPGDDLFKRLVRGRDSLYENISLETFENTFGELFRIDRRITTIEDRRWLYLLRRRSA